MVLINDNFAFRKMIFSNGNSYRKYRSFSFLAFNGNITVVQLHQFFYHSEANPCSFPASPMNIFYAMKPVEYLVQLVSRDTDASVSDGALNRIVNLPDQHRDGT